MCQYLYVVPVAVGILWSVPNAQCADESPLSKASELHREANARASRQDYRGAVTDYNRAMELDPANADLYNDRGWSMQWLDPNRAMADFTRAIELDPRHVWAHLNRGVGYAAMGQFDKATADLDQAVSLANDAGWATLNAQHLGEIFQKRARVYADTGRIQESVEDGLMATRLVPGNVEARLTLARSLARQGRMDEALDQQDIAVRLAPRNPGVYADRAVTYYNGGQYKVARHELNMYLQAGGAPAHPTAQRLRDALDAGDRSRAASRPPHAQPTPANGLFLDQNSGLMWQVDGVRSLSWSEAKAYCSNLELGGFRDWRLPDAEELASLCKALRLDTNHTPNDVEATPVLWRTNLYWSSTVNPFGNASRGMLFFARQPEFENHLGRPQWFAKDARLGVRAVRSIIPEGTAPTTPLAGHAVKDTRRADEPRTVSASKVPNPQTAYTIPAFREIMGDEFTGTDVKLRATETPGCVLLEGHFEVHTGITELDLANAKPDEQGVLQVTPGSAPKLMTWCPGARHTLIGKLELIGYTFLSDSQDPLVFRMVKDHGYVYERGKGTVTTPAGERILLPSQP